MGGFEGGFEGGRRGRILSRKVKFVRLSPRRTFLKRTLWIPLEAALYNTTIAVILRAKRASLLPKFYFKQ